MVYRKTKNGGPLWGKEFDKKRKGDRIILCMLNRQAENKFVPISALVQFTATIDNSPSLADKVARSTATHTVEEIAKEIAELIKSKR